MNISLKDYTKFNFIEKYLEEGWCVEKKGDEYVFRTKRDNQNILFQKNNETFGVIKQNSKISKIKHKEEKSS